MLMKNERRIKWYQILKQVGHKRVEIMLKVHASSSVILCKYSQNYTRVSFLFSVEPIHYCQYSGAGVLPSVYGSGVPLPASWLCDWLDILNHMVRKMSTSSQNLIIKSR